LGDTRRPSHNLATHLSKHGLGLRTSVLVRLLALLDTILVALVMVGAAQGAPLEFFRDRLIFVLLVPAFQALFQTFGLYESHRIHGFGGVMRSLLAAEFVGGVLCIAGAVLIGRAELAPNLAAFTAVNTLLLTLGRAILYGSLHLLRRMGMDRRAVCVIGTWEKASGIAQILGSRPEWGMRVSLVGVTQGGGGHQFLRYPNGEDVGGDLNAVLHREVIDEVIIAVDPERLPQERPTIAVCEQLGVMGRVMVECNTHPASVLPLHSEIPMSTGLQDGPHLFWKRLLDISGALVGIAVFAIPMILAAILVKLSSPGPTIFRQRRIGLNGREFTIYKFRTMVNGADLMIVSANRSITKGPAPKDSSDFRITPVGHYLRRFSLDELPQFFNVLLGDMSLVGPRPLPVREANAIAGPHRRRFRVLPGVTGIWQVSGRSDVEFERWMSYDLEYVDNWSIGLDVKILLKTLPVMISGKGAY
jgi:exopolysaccharide biosynthesis polyprenyl glycosylphosphotransferase